MRSQPLNEAISTGAKEPHLQPRLTGRSQESKHSYHGILTQNSETQYRRASLSAGESIKAANSYLPREQGWKKIRDGVTTVNEVMRATQEF